ncbi:heparan sulfate 6-sulfotransferase [Necator americanus]|uniref:Heparan-sulfate 6-O-sulfotransferase n=1 Tax=Necator americanus TaxID=51031 RepID=W2T121_NECAM|nr:heparan sulfate 6-sulfotransferase [Necator americanus]ETN75249.1 heparan sulfate 6-sulfotransferase [Necator americanus]
MPFILRPRIRGPVRSSWRVDGETRANARIRLNAARIRVRFGRYAVGRRLLRSDDLRPSHSSSHLIDIDFPPSSKRSKHGQTEIPPDSTMLRRQDNRANSITFSRKLIVFVFVVLSAPAIYLIIGSSTYQYQYSDYTSSTNDQKPIGADKNGNFVLNHLEEPITLDSKFTWDTTFTHLVENPEQGFSINSNDVLVFVHIQKTAGTSFEKFLVRHLNIEQPCQCVKGKKRCTCNRLNKPNEVWLFSRYSTGWLCGLHADFTELYVSGCVDRMLNKKEGSRRLRRYFYTTFLREPITRFISEYRHVNRGATWIASRHICNGRAPTSDELPLCFDPHLGWDDVSLDEFLHCPFNLAFNRQTRMLADLTLVNCYARNGTDPRTRDRILLESAKRNLRNMAFFGIKERMDDSQIMFERLFNLSFNRRLSAWTRSKSNDTDVTPEQLRQIREHNELDIELYDYALKLFEHRLAAVLNRTLQVNAQNGNRFTPFEFKSPSDNGEVQFIRNDISPGERIFHKSTNNVLNNPEYESDDDDAHTSDENADIEFDRV